MNKNQRPMIGAKIPHEWMEQIKYICQETGKIPSEIVQEALAAYLGQSVNPVDFVNAVEGRLQQLERKLQRLTQLTKS